MAYSVDWNIIKQKYTRGILREDGVNYYPTVRELAKEHNVSEDAIYSQVARNNWKAEKLEYQKKVQEKLDEEKSALEVNKTLKSELLIEEAALSGILAAKKHFEKIHEDIDEGKKVTGFDIKNTQDSVRIGLDILQTLRGDNISRIKLETAQNVKLNITDPDFMEQELEFARKLIDSKKRPE